jgi:hypothetical protein
VRQVQRGSAAVETAAAALVAAALMSGSVLVGKTALAVRRAHGLARHAAALSAAGVPTAAVEAETRDYAARLTTLVPALAFRRYAGSAAARFYRLAECVVGMDIPVPPALGGGVLSVSQNAAVEEEAP